MQKTNLPKIKVHRDWQDLNQTLGTCKVLHPKGHPLFASLSLERGWRDNQPNVSCYPTGIYEVVLEYSPRFDKMLWEVKGVPGRSECKFHSANFWHDLNGCTALGVRPKHIDNDGYIDVTSSNITMRDFHKALKGYTRAILEVTAESDVC